MLSHQTLNQSVDIVGKGGAIGCWSQSLLTLHNDLRLLRPTAFGATPVCCLFCFCFCVLCFVLILVCL
jgi:hypothetical protein